MARTEAGTRAVILAAIQGIRADLGLADTATIHDTLLEVTPGEKIAEYLAANITDEDTKKVRAVGLQVVGALDFYSTRNHTQRLLSITVEAYYDEYEVNALIDAMSRIQAAIGELNANLSGTVTQVTSWTVAGPSLQVIEDAGQVATMSLTIKAQDTKPEFLA